MTRKQKIWRWCRALSFLPLAVGPFQGYAQSELGRDDLCSAAYSGDRVRMWVLLQAGADPSHVGWEEHFTPLGETVRNGQVEAARMLLAWGADPNIHNDRGFGNTAATTNIGQPRAEQQ